MKQNVVTVRIALVAFAAGFISSRLLTFEKPAVQTLQVEPESLSNAESLELADANTSSTDATAEQNPFSLASFETVFDPESTAPVSTMSPTAEALTLSETSEVILSHFPNLDPDTLTGWSEAYRDLPRAELVALLEQQQLMPSLLSQSSYLSPCPLTRPDEGIELAIRHAKENLLHIQTDGYRRHSIRFRLTEVDAASAPASLRMSSMGRELRPGAIRKTGRPLDLAIEGDGNLMFRLEPGPIFTRCGNFQRLDDGRIGIHGASDDHALFGDLKIPDVFSDISVNDSGRMTVTCADGATSEVGIIQLARVRGDTELDTKNGVYFWPQEASAPGFTMEPAKNVVVAALENSNVVASETTELLRNLKLISEVFSFREN